MAGIDDFSVTDYNPTLGCDDTAEQRLGKFK